MDKYQNNLIIAADKLDKQMPNRGQWCSQYVADIIEKNDDQATLKLLKHISDIVSSKNKTLEILKSTELLKIAMIEYHGHKKLLELTNSINVVEDNRSLEELLEELDSLVGLQKVKNKVRELIAYQKIQKMRRDNNLFTKERTMHLAFLGNPGTGKTTVARIVGRIYKQLGLLSKGHFIEASRTDLIAGYQGQTALKVKKLIEKSIGGVLFIDEAYSITENEHSDSYGRECLTELTKALEDYRNDLVVIVAGYTEPMNIFFKSNPGLKSRFNTFIEFDDYNSEELIEIFKYLCVENDYQISNELVKKIKDYFLNQVKNNQENFANGRLVRNTFEDVVMCHAQRLYQYVCCNRYELMTLKAEDFNRL